jgi:4-alpha-glucanotransferase
MDQASDVLTRRQAGVLLHPSSLAGPHGTGDLGDGARAMADWLLQAGVRLWQILPLCPPGDRFRINPYVSWSALAGNPQLVSLHDLHREGLLERSELDGPPSPEGWLDQGPVRDFKAERVRRAAGRLLRAPGHRLHAALQAFRLRESWPAETALFAALASRHGSTDWRTWPAPLARCEPSALARARAELAQQIELVETEQFLFEHQWRELRAYCRERGVRLLGDVPIYVTPRSADVWLHQEQFQLLPDGRLPVVSGCPPDVFAREGQKWGNPLYRWEVMARDGYRWWRQRLARALEHADSVRIDHFRAFAAHWEIPTDASAKAGRWVPGPGLAFFEAMRAALGPLPLCVEDLGDIDAAVLELRDRSGFPGMCILEFGFEGGAANPHLPHNHVARRIVYPANHDNDTVLGWWRALGPGQRSHVQRYLGRHGDDIAWDLIRAALASVGSVAVVQAQDLLALGSEARMNDPASYARPPGEWRNWSWRMLPGALGGWYAERLRRLIGLYGRDAARA